jgi:cobalt-zinc-cadmium efflux system outer membrane protein
LPIRIVTLPLRSPRTLRRAPAARPPAAAGLLPIGASGLPGAALAFLLLLAPPAEAEAQAAGDTLRLTLPEARELALRQNPELLAVRQELPAAAGAMRQARLFFVQNPTLEAEGQPEGQEAGGPRDYRLGIEQEVEWAGQRGLRVAAARSGVQSAAGLVADAARRTTTAVTVAYLSAIAAERRLALAREILALDEQLLAAVTRQLELGDVSGLELNLARIEVGRGRTRVLRAERDRTGAVLDLLRELGLEPDTAVALEDPDAPGPDARTLDPDSLVALALLRRPDLAVRAAEAERLEAQSRLVRREALPNLALRAGTEAEDGEDPRLVLGVGLPLPLFNRNQGIAAELDARVRQARLERRALEARIRTEVEQALRSYASASRAAAVFEEEVLAQARENQRLLETAYRGGKVGLAELLLIRNQLFETEAEYWDAWQARGAALAELEAATGGVAVAAAQPSTGDAE